MTNLKDIAPMMYVEDMAATERFFVELLGFECYRRFMPSYGYFWREKIAFRVLSLSEREKAQVNSEDWLCYVDVEDVDLLLKEIQPKLPSFPQVQVHGPEDQEYGQRELKLSLPDGHWMVFGAPIPERS